MEKREFRKIIKELGFGTQKNFAQLVGVKETTFTTYKHIPAHIIRIVQLAQLAKQSGIDIEDIKEAISLEKN